MTSKIRQDNTKNHNINVAFLRSQTSWNWGLTVEPGPWKGRRWQSLGVWNPGPVGYEKRFKQLTSICIDIYCPSLSSFSIFSVVFSSYSPALSFSLCFSSFVSFSLSLSHLFLCHFYSSDLFLFVHIWFYSVYPTVLFVY